MTPGRGRALSGRWLAVVLVAALALTSVARHAGGATAAPPAPPVEWPDTEISRRARAWFAQLAADEATARAFFAEHMAPAALAEAGIEARLERRRGLLGHIVSLLPLAVVHDEPALLELACEAGNGDRVIASFRAEPAPPHRLLGVGLEATGRGPGDRRPSAAERTAIDDTAAVAELRRHLDARAAAGEFSGVALLARDGRVLYAGAWGLADRARGVAATPGTRFNVGSIGKVFTRIAIAQLAAAGRLSLADPLSKFLPDFPHADSITIDMLCAHRSGVGDIFNVAFVALDKSRLRHNRDYLQLIRDQALWFAPGTSHRYSNGGYVLLGEVIAKASGEDYYDYLAKHVFARAGMAATSAPLEGDGTPDVARGYTREGAAAGAETDNVATRPARGSAAGGTYATAADLLALDQALFAGRLCPPAWAAWVAGGPEPRPGAAAPAGPPGVGFAGGAPGIAAEWTHEGAVTLVVLANRDPQVTQPVVEPLLELVRRMRQ